MHILKSLYRFCLRCKGYFLVGLIVIASLFFLPFLLSWVFSLEKSQVFLAEYTSKKLGAEVHLQGVELTWRKEQKIEHLHVSWKGAQMKVTGIIWKGFWFAPVKRGNKKLFFELEEFFCSLDNKQTFTSTKMKGSLLGSKVEFEPFECFVSEKISFCPRGIFDLDTQEVDMIIRISGTSINRLLKLKVFPKEEWIEIPFTGHLSELAHMGSSLYKVGIK